MKINFNEKMDFWKKCWTTSNLLNNGRTFKRIKNIRPVLGHWQAKTRDHFRIRVTYQTSVNYSTGYCYLKRTRQSAFIRGRIPSRMAARYQSFNNRLEDNPKVRTPICHSCYLCKMVCAIPNSGQISIADFDSRYN